MLSGFLARVSMKLKSLDLSTCGSLLFQLTQARAGDRMAMLKEHDQTGLALKTLYPITPERAPKELACFSFFLP